MLSSWTNVASWFLTGGKMRGGGCWCVRFWTIWNLMAAQVHGDAVFVSGGDVIS